MGAQAGHKRIAIIGSGFSGLCLGIQLRKAGIESFTIFEKSDGVGGTWRDNSYPGAACDVPSMAYCFSFEQKTDWSRKWAPQPEIQEYMEHCAHKYDLMRHIRFNAAVVGARFDERAAVWRISLEGGDEVEADVLVSGVGQLNRPFTPHIEGLERFRGVRFHSARWDHGVDLTGKRVGVVGNAASAIQFIPQIATEVAHLSIFQRSANWMIPRNDRAYTAAEKRRFARFPLLARAYRALLWLQLEMNFPTFLGNRFTSGAMRKLAEQYLKDAIADPALRAALTPDYPIGGKRILISDDYYQSLNRPNVEVVTSGIERVDDSGVVTRDGASHPLDVLVFATGFLSTDFLAPMHIEGLGGRALDGEWRAGAQAYRGITVAGFPNLFLMYGPNTNLGHNSILFMIECQASYILQAIEALERDDLAYLDVRYDAMNEYNRQIQSELARTVWAATPKSWYKTASGRITNNWSGTTTRYWWTTRRFDRWAYRAEPARRAVALPAEPARPAATPRAA